MRKLKVYGVNADGKTRLIVAATSQKNAAELMGVKVSHLRTYGCETGNKEEIELAMRVPGDVWGIGCGVGETWIKQPNVQGNGLADTGDRKLKRI